MPSLIEALEEKYGLGGSCGSCGIIEGRETIVSIFVPKLPPRLCVPELLVLNDCDIDRAGEPEDLKKKVYPVKELDLAQNKLENWNEVFCILSHMPRVEFVNLSLNRLLGPVMPPSNFGMNNLRSLVLNNTRLQWESVESLLNVLPALQELHLSLNDYRNVLIDTDDDYLCFDECLGDLEIVDEDDEDDEQHRADLVNENVCQCGTENDNNVNIATENQNTEAVCNDEPVKCSTSTSSTPLPSSPPPSYKRTDSTSSNYRKTNPHPGVKMLHFTGNPVSDWLEVCRLGRVFPNLESLVLAECPIKSVEEIPKSPKCDNSEKSASSHTEIDKDPPYLYFRNLEFLNLSSTNINTWDDIDRLSKFPSLKKLRVQNWPLWDKCESTEHERRQLLIARLPGITILNGGGIVGLEEREDAERAFIRYYMDKPESDRPARYEELVAKHGKLDPLVKIDLRPEKRVKVTFIYGDVREVRTVDVYRTVVDLKHRLERVVGIPPSKMRLYYVDQGIRDMQGPEEMKYPQKQLYSYNIQTGDEIIIEQKK